MNWIEVPWLQPRSLSQPHYFVAATKTKSKISVVAQHTPSLNSCKFLEHLFYFILFYMCERHNILELAPIA